MAMISNTVVPHLLVTIGNWMKQNQDLLILFTWTQKQTGVEIRYLLIYISFVFLHPSFLIQ